MRKTSRKLSPLAKLAEKAMRIAVAEVRAEHRRRKLPLYVWQKNRIVRIPPHQIKP